MRKEYELLIGDSDGTGLHEMPRRRWEDVDWIIWLRTGSSG